VSTAAGVAGIGALSAAAASHLRDAAATPSTASSPEGLMAYVRDGSNGELHLMVGTREVHVHDPELVRRLHAAATGARPQAAGAVMLVR
jgi:hypothetical protein